MLTRLHRAFAPVGTRVLNRAARAQGVRAFSTALSKTAPEYKLVPFEKEDVEEVMQEVPAFSFYQVGYDDPVDNVYKLIGLDQSVLTPEEIQAPQQKEPKLEFSKLENGLRIASIDKGGLTASLGLFVNAGSRHENPANLGVSHLIEQVAYYSTAHLSHIRQLRTLETLGASVSVSAGREHMVYHSEVLRKYMPIVVPLMVGNVLFPRFLPWELEEIKKEKLPHLKEKIDKNVDSQVTELLHAAAYHNNTLGHKLYASDRTLTYFDEHTLRNFMLDHYSPDRMVLVGVNVDHAEFAKWAMRSFVDYNPIPHKDRPEGRPVYTGGDVRQEAAIPQLHLAIGFETSGWNSADLVPATLLQTILGGGGSFSTGGPGKGMHTRLYTDVLNKNEWVESCMAFNTMYSDSGLFGIYATGSPFKAPQLVNVITEQLTKLSVISADELKRAKNSLKSSVLMNLECRNIVLEDIARQLLMSNKVVSGKEFCAAIDACSAADIQAAAAKLLSKRPSVAAYGDISTVPHYEEVVASLKKK